MKIITTDYLYRDGEYKKGYAIAFEEKIVAVAPYQEIRTRYPQAELLKRGNNSILYPGFINTHVHLEFSANKTTLKYGAFLPWLESVIASREQLLQECNTQTMQDACNQMLSSGITTVGAISSMGLDLEAYVASPLKTVFYNELVGSNPESVDALYDDFLQRYEASAQYREDGIIPAIAIHSPYALHPIVLQKAVKFAREKGSRLTAHFLESQAEREWLEHSSGVFQPFFDALFKQQRATMGINEFLSKFDGYPTHFAHCIQAKERELEKIADQGHSIAHCPRSNRYLGCGRLDLERLQELGIPFSIATDGLSSNNTLSIFDEMRAALMLHSQSDINQLAELLIRSTTEVAGEILDLKVGKLAKGYEADFALIELPQAPRQESDISLWSILHTQSVKELYIGGESII